MKHLDQIGFGHRIIRVEASAIPVEIAGEQLVETEHQQPVVVAVRLLEPVAIAVLRTFAQHRVELEQRRRALEFVVEAQPREVRLPTAERIDQRATRSRWAIEIRVAPFTIVASSFR